MKSSILIAALVSVFSITAFGTENKSPEAQAVNTACAADAATAGCDGKLVGTGLRKCVHAHKKAHKDFKISDACKEAMGKLRESKKEVN